jgi:hypothetical protein
MEAFSSADLVRLIERVFRPRAADRGLAVLVDLPDERVPDHPDWTARREMAATWCRKLSDAAGKLGLERVALAQYPNVGRNNADLPDEVSVGGQPTTFEQLFAGHSILVAPTEFSATAPLKLAARRHGFRAATMPGFKTAMLPALQLDYEEIDRRCRKLAAALDDAQSASLRFAAGGREQELFLDLRHRRATASGGLVHRPGTAGNLPSGETYIVPYEGERTGDPSGSRGELPVELDGELMVYRIENNCVAEVLGEGPRAAVERREVVVEPAYANVAELGIGLLADYGIRPVGEILLDEKLGLHIAFGRSDHFGGSVGVEDFTGPEKVIHIDRVYIPEVQPQVRVLSVDLTSPDGTTPLMRDGRMVPQG